MLEDVIKFSMFDFLFQPHQQQDIIPCKTKQNQQFNKCLFLNTTATQFFLIYLFIFEVKTSVIMLGRGENLWFLCYHDQHVWPKLTSSPWRKKIQFADLNFYICMKNTFFKIIIYGLYFSLKFIWILMKFIKWLSNFWVF